MRRRNQGTAPNVSSNVQVEHTQYVIPQYAKAAPRLLGRSRKTGIGTGGRRQAARGISESSELSGIQREVSSSESGEM